jgi:bifunctional non-homologous end joining protein LigD
VDWLRNTRGATAVAAWSTRARPGAPVSVPVAWEELAGLKSGDQFRLADVPSLVSRRTEDPWKDMPASKQRLTRAMTARLEG